MVHGGLGALVLALACIVSTGYALTCRNMYLVVEKEIRHRLQVTAEKNTANEIMKLFCILGYSETTDTFPDWTSPS